MIKWWLAVSPAYVAVFSAIALAETTAPEDKIITYPANVRTKPGSYIVEFDENIHATNANAFITGIEAIPEATVSNQFTSIFNGFAVSTSRSTDPLQLAKVRGVKRVWPVRFHDLSYNMSEINSTSPFLHHMTGVERAMKELNLNGTGVKIGIVDSGVDYNHPELGACWKTPGCPWQYGSDFIGDKYDYTSDNPIIDPNPTPMDCDGHGTHVSGIIGARGPTVHGVAPGATLGMYRVFSCPVGGTVSASDDILLQGIEAAYNDGHDVISLSLGGGGWPEDPLSVACSKIASKGVVVVAANGNDGSNGLFTAGAPAVGRGIISVGSVDNWNITGAVATITTSSGPRAVYIATSDPEDRPFNFPAGVAVTAPLDSTGSDLGCAAFSADLNGKVALVKRGICPFSQKAQYAFDAGAVGLLVYNNVDGVITPATNPPVGIPVAMVSQKDGEYILQGTKEGDKHVSLRAVKGEFDTFPSDTGGRMSDFSSYGPSPELDIDPVISAPGGNIWSTYPIKQGSYASLSGTSMATPYISGTVALLKQARPKLSVDEVHKALLTSAKPLTDDNTGRMIHPYWSGSGLVNVYDAVKSRASISPSVLSLNDTNFSPIKGHPEVESLGARHWTLRTLTVNNTDYIHGVTVSIENLVSDSLSMYAPNGTLTLTPRVWPESDNSTVDSTTLPHVLAPNSTLYIPAGKSKNMTVYIVAPSGLQESDRWFYGGFINFSLKWDGDTACSEYVVPYAGFNGNYRRLKIFTPNDSSGLPALANSSQGILSDPSQLVISGNATALLLYSIEVPTRILSATMVSSTGKVVGYLGYGYVEYDIRNLPLGETPVSGAIIANSVFSDKEETTEVDVPPGRYHARLMALYPFGNPKNPEDYQTWDSPEFTIA